MSLYFISNSRYFRLILVYKRLNPKQCEWYSDWITISYLVKHFVFMDMVMKLPLSKQQSFYPFHQKLCYY